MSSDSEVNELREELVALSERVEALERAPREAVASEVQGGDPLWALAALRTQRAGHPSTVDGVVVLSGSVTLPTGAPVEWQQSAGTAALFQTEWAERAAAFAALGHPVRVELLRQVLSGTCTTAELAELAGLGTTGQLHHHLRELLAAGWLTQAGRGNYEVPIARIVPLLVCLAAVA